MLSLGGHMRGSRSDDGPSQGHHGNHQPPGKLHRGIAQDPQNRPDYRPDIDGLRAVAVLPVVLYHAGLGFPGGFVGVDVFFVISGYLITSLIFGEMQQGRFSIVTFYERRIRRIIPALLVVLAASAAAAYALFMPPDFDMFGRSVIATALFVSNMHFASQVGYFDAASSVKPLLHTWSLAVEEQFYIFFPLLLLALHRWMLPFRLPILSALCAASLALNLWLTGREPADAFFLAPPRFWELGLGCLLALAPRLAIRPTVAAVAAFAGVAMIVTAVFTISDRTAFPGAWALLPCIGAALIIAAGSSPNALSRRVLGFKPLVFVGLISYSLYLWHWPLIVFTQYAGGRSLDRMEALVLVAASLVLATMSWWLIELPIRRRRLFVARRTVLALACGMIALTCVMGAAVHVFDGFPGRLPSDVQAIYAARRDEGPFLSPKCLAEDSSGPTEADVRSGNLCPMGAAEGDSPSFIVWGDSHAAAMAPAIDAAAKTFHRVGLFAGRTTCPPLIQYQGVSRNKQKRDACIAHNSAVLDMIKTMHIPEVFLVARWPREVLGAEYGREGMFFDPNAPYARSDRSAEVAAALDRTLTALSNLGVHVVLVADVPEPGYDVPYSLARAALHHRAPDVDPPRAVVEERRRQAVAILRAAAGKFGADLVDPIADFCDQERCKVESDGMPLYMDADHLTQTAAHRLKHLYDPIFAVHCGVPRPVGQ